LLGQLSQDTGTLVRKEFELARVEVGRIAAFASRRLVLVGVGAAIALAGMLALTAAAVLAGIALGLSPLVSASLVALLLLVVGGVLAWRGISGLRAADLMPTETIRTVKNTASWAREQSR